MCKQCQSKDIDLKETVDTSEISVNTLNFDDNLTFDFVIKMYYLVFLSQPSLQVLIKWIQ